MPSKRRYYFSFLKYLHAMQLILRYFTKKQIPYARHIIYSVGPSLIFSFWVLALVRYIGIFQKIQKRWPWSDIKTLALVRYPSMLALVRYKTLALGRVATRRWSVLGPTFYIGLGSTLMNIGLGSTFLYQTRANSFEFFEIFQYIRLGPTLKKQK